MKQTQNKTLRVLLTGLREYDWERFHPKNMDRQKLHVALRSLIRPIANFSEVKFEGRGSLLIANVICVLMFVVSAIEYAFTGFSFNYNDPDKFDFLVTLLSSSLLLVLWAISNWGVCSLLDGEGSFREVWIATCYAMLPRVLFTVPLVLVSNWLTLDEQGIYGILTSFLLLWSGLLLFLGMMVMHQYSVKKTVASVLLSIAGIAVILFIAMLFFSMSQQFIAFIETVVDEIRYRL